MADRETMWTSEGPEEPLLGGDVTEGIVRVGDTVRRPRTSSSEAVRTVLDHLERAGFEGAPRFLGVDDRGRDVLSFVEGEVAGRPAPAWVADTSHAVSVARLLRDYHVAVSSLGVPLLFAGDRSVEPDGIPPAIQLSQELVGHRDVTLENVVFRDERAVALIDFDLARRSAPIEDVCNMLQWWAPWMPPEDRPHALADVDPFERAAAMVDAYGLDSASRSMLVPAARNGAARSWHLMRMRADRDGGGWRRMWDEGVGDVIRRRQEWLRFNEDELQAAVAGR